MNDEVRLGVDVVIVEGVDPCEREEVGDTEGDAPCEREEVGETDAEIDTDAGDDNGLISESAVCVLVIEIVCVLVTVGLSV